jgi:hypothetical protein
MFVPHIESHQEDEMSCFYYDRSIQQKPIHYTNHVITSYISHIICLFVSPNAASVVLGASDDGVSFVVERA